MTQLKFRLVKIRLNFLAFDTINNPVFAAGEDCPILTHRWVSKIVVLEIRPAIKNIPVFAARVGCPKLALGQASRIVILEKAKL